MTGWTPTWFDASGIERRIDGTPLSAPVDRMPSGRSSPDEAGPTGLDGPGGGAENVVSLDSYSRKVSA